MRDLPHRLREVAEGQPYPILFATVSGADLYGFPSGDSDWDLRGVHVLPVEQVLRLGAQEDTIDTSASDDGLELDLVTHDVAKFMRLMLKRNGYVLEQLHSPLVVCTCREHEELKHIAGDCVTRHHAHHYLGFARNQWELLLRDSPPRIKPLLYAFRVLLTGIHLMRTGRVEANLRVLNEEFRLPYVDTLIEQKTGGQESEALRESDLRFFRSEYERLVRALEEERDRSTLPEQPSALEALDDLLVRLRLRGFERL